MNFDLKFRKAKIEDLRIIISLYVDDELGQTRENLSPELYEHYLKAFNEINKDPNHYLAVVENKTEVIGTCHLTLIPSLTFIGQKRLQIEAVHIASEYRGQHIGEWMMRTAIEYGKDNNALIIQLTTNKRRIRAKNFYEKLGFKATHAGMKLYLKNEI